MIFDFGKDNNDQNSVILKKQQWVCTLELDNSEKKKKMLQKMPIR